MNDSDSAWALLALRSAPGSPSRVTWQGRQSPVENVIARLEGKGFEYMVRRDKIIIGRRTSREKIDVNMGHSAFISRHHLEIYHQAPNFYMKCISKNGIFVDGMFVRSDAEPIILPKSCTFRFPSTNIKLAFQSLINDEPIDLKMAQVGTFKPPTQSPQPVKDTCDFRSQPQSPADTISAANSCPTSPRPSTKWHTSSRTQPNSPQSSHHHNNNNMNNSNNINSNIMITSAGYTEMFDQNFMDASEVILDTDGNSTVVPGGVVDNNVHHQMLYNPTQSLSTTNNIGLNDSRSMYHHEPTSAASSTHTASSSRHHGEDGKPPYSYAQLIVQAISAAPDKQLTLNGIYSYITRNYPYYKTADKGWQNSIRHNLSLNRYFHKVPRNSEEPGKGSFWRIETSNESKLLDQAYRRRRKRENSNNSASHSASATPNPEVSISQRSASSFDGPGVKVEPCDDISQPMETLMEKNDIIVENRDLRTDDQTFDQQCQQQQKIFSQSFQTQVGTQAKSQRPGADEGKPQDVTTVASCVSSIVSSVVSQGGNGDQ